MEKALLVGLQLPKVRRAEIEASLDELQRLTETAGATAVQRIIQRREKIDPAYFIGKGKADELRVAAQEAGIRTIIFDDDLRPVQQKNLEELLDAKIIDRTRLILDIFAQRARSKEGLLQVERAQLAYSMPRLSKKGIMLDNQVGGIGTRRGPGERKLEVERRAIRDAIAELDTEIRSIADHRDLLRKRRINSQQATVAIVGYTNAGKSTLLNLLSHSRDVYADDKLFATLDPTTRQVPLPGGRVALFTDTVGFINKLPHALVAAFRGTLEEVKQANCLMHVIDISHPDCEKQVATVLSVLKDLGADKIPLINVYNKVDRLSPDQKRRLINNHYLMISAKTGEGLPELLRRIELMVTPTLRPYKLLVPYTQISVIAAVYNLAVVKTQQYAPNGVELIIESTPEQWAKIQSLIKRIPV